MRVWMIEACWAGSKTMPKLAVYSRRWGMMAGNTPCYGTRREARGRVAELNKVYSNSKCWEFRVREYVRKETAS